MTKGLNITFTLFYLLILTHLCTCKFLRPHIPRLKKGSTSKRNGSVSSGIIGGKPALPGEFPYQIQILLSNYQRCGGTLVIAPTTRKQIVITAAHCIYLDRLHEFSIRAGSIFINGKGSQTLFIRRAVIHPKYISTEVKCDLAVLFPNGEFQLSKYVKPLELPRANEIITKEVTVTGWGKTNVDPGDLPDQLLAVVMPVIGNRKCDDLWNGGEGSLILPSHLCAGNLNGTQGTCHGDSGGPAMAVRKGTRRKFLAGVTIFGHIGCESKGFPTVFTRVSKFLKWIDKVSKKYENER